MAKPSELPRWASGAGAVITPAPSEGKKDVGWAVSERPPRQYMNWLFRRIYEWCAYLDTLTNEALTWNVKQAFNAGLSSGAAPTAAADVVRKAELDALDAVVDSFVAGAGAAIDAQLVAGWLEDAGAQSPRVWLDPTGVVRCRGRFIRGVGASTSTSLGVLPLGFRPAATRRIGCAITTVSVPNAYIAEVRADGSIWAIAQNGVTPAPTPTDEPFDISGIAFQL